MIGAAGTLCTVLMRLLFVSLKLNSLSVIQLKEKGNNGIWRQFGCSQL